MNLVNEEGFLEIPLFHGTSSIFLNSIKKYGLGGKIKTDLLLLEMLCDAHESLGTCNTWWLENSWHYRDYFLTNTIIKGQSNYKYGYLYLSPSRTTAEKYARNNDYGSELLTCTIEAYEQLIKIHPIKADYLVPNDHYLKSIVGKDRQAILIKVKNIKASSLKTERGVDVINQLDKMIDLQSELTSLSTDIVWQQCNFMLSDSVVLPNFEVEFLNSFFNF